MDTANFWTILAEQGILFRPAITYGSSWEYTVTKLGEVWHGPYATREEAFRAALRHLLSLIREEETTSESTSGTGAVTRSDSTDRETQLHSLRQQLRALEKEYALRGIAASAELEPRITYLIEQIRHIEKRNN